MPTASRTNNELLSTAERSRAVTHIAAEQILNHPQGYPVIHQSSSRDKVGLFKHWVFLHH